MSKNETTGERFDYRMDFWKHASLEDILPELLKLLERIPTKFQDLTQQLRDKDVPNDNDPINTKLRTMLVLLTEFDSTQSDLKYLLQ